MLKERDLAADLNRAAVLSLLSIAGIETEAHPDLCARLSSCLERPAAADWKPIRFTIPWPPTPIGVLRMFV